MSCVSSCGPGLASSSAVGAARAATAARAKSTAAVANAGRRGVRVIVASRRYFAATMPGGCQVPSPGGRIDGGVSVGAYSRITR